MKRTLILILLPAAIFAGNEKKYASDGGVIPVKAPGQEIVKTDSSSLMTLMTLKSLERQLPFDRFCRVHLSWIVNVDKVSGIKSGKLLVGAPSSPVVVAIPLSDSCKASFFELLSHRSIVLRPE